VVTRANGAQCHTINVPTQVETAGDCYIAAGGLTLIDEDGFICIDPCPNPKEAAEKVLSFAKVCACCAHVCLRRCLSHGCGVCCTGTLFCSL